MIQDLRTYINALHTIFNYLDSLKDNGYDDELIDIYNDLLPIFNDSENVRLFDISTKNQLKEFSEKMELFWVWKSSKGKKKRLTSDYVEHSEQWQNVIKAGEKSAKVLSHYLSSLGIQPGVIFDKNRHLL